MSSEELVQQQVRLKAAYVGQYWRNNVGACLDQTGRMIRYGLANDSAKLNKRIKSSDLIGVTPVLIRPDHVGQVLGVFTAIEAKHSEWVFSPSDERAVAQKAYHEIVRSVGGIAGFVRCVEDFERLVRR